MSRILAVVGPDPVDPDAAAKAMRALDPSDQAEVDLRSGAGWTLGVTRRPWEFHDDFSGRVGVMEMGDLAVVADASLYYRDNLRERLRGLEIEPRGSTPSHLIAGAYLGWGAHMGARLDGDFAAVIWDRSRGRLMALRDRIGLRPLYHARIGRNLALCSSAKVLAELAGRSNDLNLAHLGLQASTQLWSCGSDTCFNGVEVLPPAHRLIWTADDPHCESYWHLATAPDPHAPPLDEAAEQLASLLEDAVYERMGSDTTTVWMSGGRDSTAVFGAGMSALCGRHDTQRRLRAVSISYPPDDPGHEDPLIRDVTEFWNTRAHWLRSRNVPLLEGLHRRAAEHDEPPAQLFELWNRWLAHGTRRLDSHIALDGSGGDNLFLTSGIDLADHLRSGRLGRFALESWRRRHEGWTHLARTGLLPVIPEWVLRAGSLIPGVDLPLHYAQSDPPPWIRDDFLKEHGLPRREARSLRDVHADSLAQQETILRIRAPLWSWGASFLRGTLLEEDVEVRSPLFDRRVVEFALARPLEERVQRTSDKILLRRAGERFLPPSVTASRPDRSGSTEGFARIRMSEQYPELLRMLLERPIRLADLGIVDPGELRRAAESWDTSEATRIQLFHTLSVEFWLRGRDLAEEDSEASVQAMFGSVVDSVA